jgi:hypothetical protein
VECGNVVFTTNVEIFEPTNGDFSYPETEYCSNSAPTASPVFSGTGGGSSTGIFTATPEGLSIDPTTGQYVFENFSPRDINDIQETQSLWEIRVGLEFKL